MSATIQTVAGYAENIIWEGRKILNNNTYISYTALENRSGTIKVDVETEDKTTWKQINFNYIDYSNNFYQVSGETINGPLTFDIPSEKKDIVINVNASSNITITKIYNE